MADIIVPPTIEKIKVATDFIRESSLFVEARYAWIRPLVEKVLSDTFVRADIKATIDSLFPAAELPKQTTTCPTAEQPPIPDQKNEALSLSRIKSIDLITNFGLLSRDKPIQLNEKDNLNIFYGQNGSGKSSLYLALCKTLGRTNKKVIPNIYTEEESAVCSIKYADGGGEERELEWKQGQENPIMPAMIFDSAVCTYLVRDDQENHFKLAHLKIQYFEFLQQRYAELDEALKERLKAGEEKLGSLEEILKVKVPHLFNPPISFAQDSIEEASFTDEESAKLIGLKKDIGTASQGAGGAILKNVQNAILKIEEVLKAFAFLDKTDPKKAVWKSRYVSDYFENINLAVETYNANKRALTAEGDISKHISASWINDELWLEFINKSFLFLDSLTAEERNKYEDETCLYCQQLLSSENAKSLMVAYKKIQDARKKTTEAEKRIIQARIAEIQSSIDLLDKIESINAVIEPELNEIRGKAEKILIEKKQIIDCLKSYKECLAKQTAISASTVFLEATETLLRYYSVLYNDFLKKAKDIASLVENSESRVASLMEAVAVLEKTKSLHDNKTNLLLYLQIQSSIVEIESKIKDVAAAKKTTSSLATKFSNDSQLKEFGAKLKQEYEDLGFTPSDKWKLSSKTSGETNKRVYNLGNWRLAEIFSEGEQKIHALADFFAQAEIDKFKGVYIFDDPVNSLDEIYIDAVASRIRKLTESGNQVIVFTHNLIFLNCLIKQGKSRINELFRYKTLITILENVKPDDPDSTRAAKLKKMKDELKEFDEAAKKGIKPSEIALGRVYDLMSGYIEDYVEKEILKGVVGRYRPNLRMEPLAELKKIDPDKIDKASTIYSRTSRYGTRHSKVEGAPKPTIEQLQKDFEQLETLK